MENNLIPRVATLYYLKFLLFNQKITRYAKKQSMAHTQRKEQLIETVTEEI